MWRIAGDDTPPVLTAEGNIQSGHSERITLELPKTAIVFFMGKATEYLAEKYGCAMLTDRFPRFLKVCPIYRFKEHEICFLNGGSGAPHGVDTLETLARVLQGPFAVADATSLTEAGYVGEDVENILLKLIQAAVQPQTNVLGEDFALLLGELAI